MSLTRREWLAWSGAALAAAACRPGPKQASTAPEPQRAAPEFLTRPAAATFEVADTRALLWVFTAGAPSVDVEVFQGPPPRSNDKTAVPWRSFQVAATAASGFTAVHELAELEPDTLYSYRLAPKDRYAFFTAPRPDTNAPAHFLVGADVIVDRRFDSSVMELMWSSPARFLVSLGDWPYSDRPPAAVTLAEYRRRHMETRLRDQVRELTRHLPIYAMYDDHEIVNDWDASFIARQPERFRAGQKAWDEWWPVRDAPTRRYRSWRWGRHVELFLLDGRTYRSANFAGEGPDKSMLGPAQKRWFLDGLAASTATFKVVLSTVPFAFGTTLDHWNMFTRERDELLAAVAAIPGALIICGDQHWFSAHRHGNGVREYQVGPTQAFLRAPPPPDGSVIARAMTANYGEVRIEPGPPPALTFTARAATGGILYQESIPAPGLGATVANT